MRGASLIFLGAHEGQVADPVIEAFLCCPHPGPWMDIPTLHRLSQTMHPAQGRSDGRVVERSGAHSHKDT
jgi:hypothetical protein